MKLVQPVGSLSPARCRCFSLIASLGLGWLALALTGCQPSIERGEVTGVLRRGDKPLDSVMIYFMPDPERQTPGSTSWALTDEAGRYTLEYQGPEKGTGAVVGWHRVTLEDLAGENFRGRGRPPARRVTPEMMNPATTPFRFEVAGGEQTIDIDVSAAPPVDEAKSTAAL